MARAKHYEYFNFFAILQLGCNLAIFGIVALHIATEGKCIMSPETDSGSKYCNLAYIQAGSGIGVLAVIATLNMVDRAFVNACNAMIMTALTTWYVIGAGVITMEAIKWKTQFVWRTAVWSLLWCDVALMFLGIASMNACSRNKKVRDDDELPVSTHSVATAPIPQMAATAPIYPPY